MFSCITLIHLYYRFAPPITWHTSGAPRQWWGEVCTLETCYARQPPSHQATTMQKLHYLQSFCDCALLAHRCMQGSRGAISYQPLKVSGAPTRKKSLDSSGNRLLFCLVRIKIYMYVMLTYQPFHLVIHIIVQWGIRFLYIYGSS